MAVEKFTKGDIIFREGDFQTWMYGVLSGEIGVYAGYGTDDQKELSVLTGGSFLGELGMIDCSPRSATAVCLSDEAELEKVEIAYLEGYLLRNPGNVLQIMRNTSRRLRALSKDMVEARYEADEILKARREDTAVRGLFAKLLKKLRSAGDGSAAVRVAPGRRVEGSEFANYKAGEVIFTEGAQADCMYDIYWGSIGIYADYGTDRQKLLTTLGSERVFGEMALIDNAPRSATAVCLEDSRVKVITSESFSAYFAEAPGKIIVVMQQMAERLRELTKEYTEALKALEEIVAKEEKDESLTERDIMLLSDAFHRSMMSEGECFNFF